MTNHWIDLKNSDCVLIMGSNAAENHPISFKWVMKAKDKGATLIHVDPRFTRTSAKCDVYAPIRSGSDIPFLGGLVKYILDNNKFFHEYVVNYTNASFVVGKDFAFDDGLFSGFDPKKVPTTSPNGLLKWTTKVCRFVMNRSRTRVVYSICLKSTLHVTT
jgi:formate dehydrogenase major subunit